MADPVYNNVKEDEPVNVGVPQVATGGAIIAPTGAPFKGNASVVPSKFSQSGINQVAVGIGNSIQDAINAMHNAGGGKVFLGAGTHIVTTPLVGYTGVDIEGENQSTTIIDFNSTSANLSFAGTDVYAVGTITSITSGVNVTGSGTSWLANVTTDHQLFIGNTWYKIAAVTSDTTLILSEGYQGNATLPGAAYRTSKIQRDIDIKDITLKSSTGTALVATDCRNFTLKNVKLDTNSKGFVFTNVSEFVSEQLLSVSNTSNGAELTNARLCNFYNLATPGNGGHGFALNNVETGVIMESSSNSNTSDGYNLTSCSNLVMSPVEASSNGGQGVELVSGNNNISINGIMNANTLDGIKLTATSDNCKISGCKITNNGGYGANVAASSCDNNLISTSFFDNNSSGNKNDSGTGTLWTANIPDSLNTGGNPAVGKFGGDGSDGALSISSGTTTINLGNVGIVTKNYTSISITGTGKLAFSNPHTNGTLIIIKSQGDVTITSSATCIDASGMGGAGGAATGVNENGNPGSEATEIIDDTSHLGGYGNKGSGGSGVGGAGGAIAEDIKKYTTSVALLYRKSITLLVGAGGGSGGGGNGNCSDSFSGGAGGAGGGGLYIECGGAWNFTTASGISVAGIAGGNAAGDGAAGGGGGAAGSCIVLYDSLTANSGTIVVSGGGAGAKGANVVCGSMCPGGGGGGGGYGAGNSGGNGATNVPGNGGAGPAGFSLVTQNTIFA